MSDIYYGTPDRFEAYNLSRGYVLLDVDPSQVETALTVASDWLDGRYGPVFRIDTFRTGGRDQEREWPRTGFVDGYGYAIPSETIPREIEQATYEAARRQIASPGSLSVDFTAGSAIKSASVDGAVSVTYASPASSASEAQLTIMRVDELLAPLLSGAGMLSRLSGRAHRA